MTWFTWRQFRTQAAITALALAVFGILLVISGRSIAGMYSGVAACQSDCTTVIEQFLVRVRNSSNGRLYDAALAVMYVLPPLIGIFWGAPLIARELETGTHLLAWNQSVTRTRWLATKLAMLAAATAAATGLLSWAITAWAQRIDSAAADRITPMVFGARGIVPIGYALFAFTLGATIGMLIRRTVPAMAATLAIYAAAVASMPLWIRTHLVPARHETTALDLTKVQDFLISQNAEMVIVGQGKPNSWTVSNQTIDTSGQVFTGPADMTACGRNGGHESCEKWVGTLGLRQDLTYHPDSQFWALQWAETGVFIALAVLLAGLCFWWIRRRFA